MHLARVAFARHNRVLCPAQRRLALLVYPALPDRRVKGLSLAAGKHPAVVRTNMPIPALHGAALTVVPRLRTGWYDRRGWLVAVHFGTRVTNTFKHGTGSAKQTRWRRSRLWRGTAPPRPWLWYSACNAALTLDTASG